MRIALDNDGWTPLHLCCDCADDESHCNVGTYLLMVPVLTLLNYSIKFSCCQLMCHTSYYLDCFICVIVAKFLVGKGANIESKDNNGE